MSIDFQSNNNLFKKPIHWLYSAVALSFVTIMSLNILVDSTNRFKQVLDNNLNIQENNLALISTTTTTTAKKLFASNFSKGVYLSDLYGYYPNGKGAWQDLKGVDSETGYTWSPAALSKNIPGTIFTGVQWITYASSTPEEIKSSLSSEIREVTGPQGAPVNELFTAVNKKGPLGVGSAQAEFMISRDHRYGDVTDMYITYWAKHPADLIDKLDPSVSSGNWHAQFEFKTGGYENTGNGDYRIQTTIIKNTEGKLYWMSKGDNVANGPWPRIDYWIERNYEIPVPLDKWFKFEVFWHRSTGADGRYWAAVDGQVLVDHKGPNMGDYNLPINRIFFAPAYSGGNTPVESHVTGLEIWDGFPCGVGVSCYSSSTNPVPDVSTTTPLPTPLPTINLSASPSSVDYSSASIINWSSTNASSCVASGDWSGLKSISSSESTGVINSNKNYTLTCTGNGGSTTNSVSVTVLPDTTAPTIPSGFSASNITSNSVNLSWSSATDNSGVKGYNVYRNNTKIATVTTTNYNETNLTPSTSYSYTVTAFDANGNESAKSSVVSVTTSSITTTSTTFKVLSATVANKTSSSATISVGLSQPGTVVINYGTVFNALTSSVSGTVSATNSTVNIFNLKPKTAYYYQVTATDSTGKTAKSTLNGFKTSNSGGGQ
jgi:hypothetical protein